MDEFITIIIFVLPGLISFNLIKLFGLYPSINHKNNEIVVLSAIMWVPINIIVLGFYSLVSYVLNKYYGMEIEYVYDIETLNVVSNKSIFIVYYVSASIIAAYYIAKLTSKKVFDRVLKNINTIRNKNGKASLSRDPTVWENSFSKDDAQIVKVKMQNKTYIGELKRVSTNLDNGKDIVLRYSDHWTEIMNEYDVKVEDIYIDLSSDIVIEIFDRVQCENAQELYRKEHKEKFD